MRGDGAVVADPDAGDEGVEEDCLRAREVWGQQEELRRVGERGDEEGGGGDGKAREARVEHCGCFVFLMCGGLVWWVWSGLVWWSAGWSLGGESVVL